MPSTVTTAYALPRFNTWTHTPSDPPEPATTPTFAAFVEEWTARQTELAKGGLLRISSLHRYQTAMRAHLLPFFAARPLHSIIRAQCDDFRMTALNVGRLNPGTINSIMQILRLILRAAHREGLIDRDPMSGIRPLRVSPRIIDPYDPAEVDRLIHATCPTQRVVVALAALAGLRQGEAFAIRPSDVDLDGRRLLVRRSLQRHHPAFTVDQRLGPPKTATGHREVPIQSRLRRLLDQHVEHHWETNRFELLCPGPGGDPHLPIHFHRHTFAPAIKAAGLRPMRFHDLRRSFISQCVAAGIPVAQTAAWLGHSIRMTQYYYNVGHAELLAALELLDSQATQ